MSLQPYHYQHEQHESAALTLSTRATRVCRHQIINTCNSSLQPYDYQHEQHESAALPLSTRATWVCSLIIINTSNTSLQPYHYQHEQHESAALPLSTRATWVCSLTIINTSNTSLRSRHCASYIRTLTVRTSLIVSVSDGCFILTIEVPCWVKFPDKMSPGSKFTNSSIFVKLKHYAIQDLIFNDAVIVNEVKISLPPVNTESLYVYGRGLCVRKNSVLLAKNLIILTWHIKFVW
jgi:hypothetical protein